MIGVLAENASAMLDGRSPGERDSGALFQTKPPRAGETPRQRVLTNTRVRPPGGAPDVPGASSDTTGSGPEGAGGLPAAGAADGGQSDGASGAPIPFGSAGPLGAGAQPIVVPAGNLIPTPVEAIPEPDTYALFAIGIGIIGAAQRRKRRRRLADAKMAAAQTGSGLFDAP